MNNVILSAAKPGDIAQVKMDFEGLISSSFPNLQEREFEIIATTKFTDGRFNVLINYKKEELFNSFTLSNTDFSLSFDEPFILNLHPKINDYKGNYVRWLDAPRIFGLVSKSTYDGCACKVCSEFYNYAVPNQADGTLICFACRQNPVRAYY